MGGLGGNTGLGGYGNSGGLGGGRTGLGGYGRGGTSGLGGLGGRTGLGELASNAGSNTALGGINQSGLGGGGEELNKTKTYQVWLQGLQVAPSQQLRSCRISRRVEAEVALKFDEMHKDVI